MTTSGCGYRNTCPTCLALPFQRCRSLSKGRVTDTHAARLRGEWPERCTSTYCRKQCDKEKGHDGAHIRFVSPRYTWAWGSAVWPVEREQDPCEPCQHDGTERAIHNYAQRRTCASCGQERWVPYELHDSPAVDRG